jgi:hypothetical protein
MCQQGDIPWETVRTRSPGVTTWVSSLRDMSKTTAMVLMLTSFILLWVVTTYLGMRYGG